MRLLSPAGLVGALQVCSYLGVSFAKPLNPVVVELRIRKNINPDATSSMGVPYMSVRDIVLDGHEPSAFSEYQPNSTTVTVLEHLVRMNRIKREASLFAKRESMDKRQFGGRGKKCDKKKKYKLCDGIYKLVWNALTKTCETCPGGKVPNEKTDKCVDPETPEQKRERGRCPQGKKLDPSVPGQDHTTLNPKCVDNDPEQEKRRGKCPPGKKLDPEVPGQDHNTLDPKCIDDDQRNRCPGGQSESTATKSKSPKCAPDTEPDKKCDKKDTSVHKEIGPDGQMKSSCRSTKDKEKEKANNTRGKMEQAKEKVMAPKIKENEERRKRENKGRARRSACLAIGAMTFIPAPDIEGLGELELEGLIEPDEFSHIPDIEIEDWMVTIQPREVPGGTISMDTAGLGAIFTTISKAFVRAFRGGSKGGKAAKRPDIPLQKSARVFGPKFKERAANIFASLRRKDSLLNTKRASPQAKEAAGKSGAVQNILKSKTFQECLAVGAGVALGQAVTKRQENSDKYHNPDIGDNISLTIDLKAPKKDNFPSPEDNSNILLLLADDKTDAGADETPDLALKTYQDGYNRGDRLFYEGCGSFAGGSFNNKITLLQTWNGCCKYYNGEHCEPDTGLFKQTNREDGQLRGKSDNAVSSYWCSFEPNCAGAPGG